MDSIATFPSNFTNINVTYNSFVEFLSLTNVTVLFQNNTLLNYTGTNDFNITIPANTSILLNSSIIAAIPSTPSNPPGRTAVGRGRIKLSNLSHYEYDIEFDWIKDQENSFKIFTFDINNKLYDVEYIEHLNSSYTKIILNRIDRLGVGEYRFVYDVKNTSEDEVEIYFRIRDLNKTIISNIIINLGERDVKDVAEDYVRKLTFKFERNIQAIVITVILFLVVLILFIIRRQKK